MDVVGRLAGRWAGVSKTRPSSEKWPSGRAAKMLSGVCHGAPTRRAWRKAHRAAG